MMLRIGDKMCVKALYRLLMELVYYHLRGREWFEVESKQTKLLIA